MRVSDLKTVRKAVVSVPPEAGMAEIAATMRRNGVGALVVRDGSEQLAGIVTERDIVAAVGVTWPTVVNRTAAQLMSSPVRTCSPDDRLSEVMKTMLDRRLRHLPLVEGGRLVGMVSMGDVIKSLLGEMESEAKVLRDLYLSASSR
jgi:CBS domain-containing protein